MIWHLCANRWNSAITEYALSAARSLQGTGAEQLFIAGQGSPAYHRAQAHLPVLAVQDFGLIGLLQLQRRLPQQRPDLIICYGGREMLLARFLKYLSGARVIRFRGQALSQKSGLVAGWKYRVAHSHTDLLLTPSRGLEQGLAQLLPKKAVLSVPLGCDSERFRPTESPVDRSAPTMVVLGRLDPVKGHAAMLELMVQILALWPRDEQKPCLHIIGEPANLSAEEIAKTAANLGLDVGSEVRITAARVSNLADILSAATLGVICSIDSEIICRVAEEFLLCGTPVAVSGVGSLEEVLFPGAGFSYRSLNPNETANQFVHWLRLSHRESADAKRQRAEQARSRFSLEVMTVNLTAALRWNS